MEDTTIYPESNFSRTALWLKACGKEPNPENLSVQIGCHLEEMIEFLNCISVPGGEPAMNYVAIILSDVANKLKKGEEHGWIPDFRRIAALDALCDCEVTGNGVAYMAGFDKEAADAAVLDSNDAKLVDGKPVILPGGKIGKPAGWVAPRLVGFV